VNRSILELLFCLLLLFLAAIALCGGNRLEDCGTHGQNWNHDAAGENTYRQKVGVRHANSTQPNNVETHSSNPMD
jgi:hypothetical protein